MVSAAPLSSTRLGGILELADRSEGYRDLASRLEDRQRLTVADAVRVTWGGVYVHSAPWSVASQGNSNVSHGCINLSPENADWYYNTVNIGDPIIVQQ